MERGHSSPCRLCARVGQRGPIPHILPSALQMLSFQEWKLFLLIAKFNLISAASPCEVN